MYVCHLKLISLQKHDVAFNFFSFSIQLKSERRQPRALPPARHLSVGKRNITDSTSRGESSMVAQGTKIQHPRASDIKPPNSNPVQDPFSKTPNQKGTKGPVAKGNTGKKSNVN